MRWPVTGRVPRIAANEHPAGRRGATRQTAVVSRERGRSRCRHHRFHVAVLRARRIFRGPAGARNHRHHSRPRGHAEPVDIHRALRAADRAVLWLADRAHSPLGPAAGHLRIHGGGLRAHRAGIQGRVAGPDGRAHVLRRHQRGEPAAGLGVLEFHARDPVERAGEAFVRLHRRGRHAGRTARSGGRGAVREEHRQFGRALHRRRHVPRGRRSAAAADGAMASVRARSGHRDGATDGARSCARWQSLRGLHAGDAQPVPARYRAVHRRHLGHQHLPVLRAARARGRKIRGTHRAHPGVRQPRHHGAVTGHHHAALADGLHRHAPGCHRAAGDHSHRHGVRAHRVRRLWHLQHHGRGHGAAALG